MWSKKKTIEKEKTKKKENNEKVEEQEFEGLIKNKKVVIMKKNVQE